MFSSGKRSAIFLTDLGRILILFVFLLLPWNLIKLTKKLDLADALGASPEVVDFIFVFIISAIGVYGYCYFDYIIIKLKFFTRGRMCNSQRVRTITMIIGALCVIYVLFVDTKNGNTILDRIDVAATVSIAVAALILQYSLRSDETKKQRERDMKKYLNVIVSRYLGNEKMDANGIVLAAEQNSQVRHYDQNIRVEWSFGHLEPANASVIVITIKNLSAINSTNQQKEYQFIDYIIRAGVVYLQCYICYSNFRGKETESDMSFPISVEYFYDNEWNNVMLSLYTILNEITLEKEFNKISDKNDENELESSSQ